MKYHRLTLLLILRSISYILLTVFSLTQQSFAASSWSSWTRDLNYKFPGQYGIAGDPSIIKIGDQYRMYYGCFDPLRKPQGTDVCVATSGDGLKWDMPNLGNQYVLGQVLTPSPDSWHTAHETPYVVQWKNKFFLYFTGYKDQGGILKSTPAPLGLAISADGFHFTAEESPVIETSTISYDQSGIVSPSVVQINKNLYMVYAAHCYTTNCTPSIGAALMVAESADGQHWTKLPRLLFDKSTVLPSFVKSLYQMAEPDLVLGPDKYLYLFFTALQGDNPHMIGVARSKTLDGPWIFNPDPIAVAQGDETEVVAPNVLIEGNKVRMWFSAFSKSGISIAYSETSWPLFKANGHDLAHN